MARRLQGCTLLAVAALLFSGCALKPNRAPVEERSATPRTTVAAASPALNPEVASGEPARPAVVDNNSGRAGYYTVKPGDTLIRIGLDNGQNWKDLVRWNNLGNPNLIEVGQVIRIVPPGVDPASATTRPVTTARVETRPLETRPEPKPGSAIVPICLKVFESMTRSSNWAYLTRSSPYSIATRPPRPSRTWRSTK